MGTYTNVTVAGYPLLTTKSAVAPEVMTVFRETDRRVYQRKRSDRNPLEWGDTFAGDNSEETAIEYSSITRNVIDRLNVMGFTLSRAQADYEQARTTEIAKYESWSEDRGDALEPEVVRDWHEDRCKLLKSISFDRFLIAFAEVIGTGLRPVPSDDHMKKSIDEVTKYILSDDDGLFGFFCRDVRQLLRVACEVVAPESFVVQDITDLADSGYYEENEPVCSYATESLTAGHPENSPRIILTEGSTDVMVLRNALLLLYPHLFDYYTFFDFDASRSQGGAGHLVSLVKAFSATGITNRIIALFDNDTAAREARRSLDASSLRPNIAVMSYPDLDSLRSYPTHGPAGLTLMDVNGLAASIELYLGKDILLDERGEMTPVQWKGYSESLKQYQGEVMRKSSLISAFHQKVSVCKADPNALKTTDWLGLTAILERIFHVFD